jgi:hypothetical protein
MLAYALKPLHHALTIIMENADPSLVTQGWVYLSNSDPGATITENVGFRRRYHQ